MIRDQATTLQYLVGFGTLYLRPYETHPLTDCIGSDWLYGASDGIPTLPGVIGINCFKFQIREIIQEDHALFIPMRTPHCIIFMTLEVTVSPLE
jgi:hypothetical protein